MLYGEPASPAAETRMPHTLPPDDLSGWTLPPPAARARGEVDPVRVFDTAEAAMAFLARHVDGEQRRVRHLAAGALLPDEPRL